MEPKHPLYEAKPGEFYAIELPDGSFGYVRIHRGSALGVLPARSTHLLTSTAQLLTCEPQHYFEFMAPNDDSTRMVRIGSRHFFDPADFSTGFAPPRWIAPSIFKGFYQILERGERRRAEQAETIGLQRRETVTPTKLRDFVVTLQPELHLLESNATGNA